MCIPVVLHEQEHGDVELETLGGVVVEKTKQCVCCFDLVGRSLTRQIHLSCITCDSLLWLFHSALSRLYFALVFLFL